MSGTVTPTGTARDRIPFALAVTGDPYAQRRDWTAPGWLESAWESFTRRVLGRGRLSRWRIRRVMADVRRWEREWAALPPQPEAMNARIRRELGRHGFDDRRCALALAWVRREAGRSLGLTPFETQVRGAYVMLQGRLLEMDTGEGKTLTAGVAAAVAGMAGLAVHVITVNDYLAERDAEKLAPLFACLGLRVGTVLEPMQDDARRQQYLADIVYCSNKTVVFDYLRDRQRLADRMQPLPMALRCLAGQGQGQATTLRGLHMAIVDEADSIFIDEARTPLILSVQHADAEAVRFHEEAITLARGLVPGQDVLVDRPRRQVTLTPEGQGRLASLAGGLTGVWLAPLRREETVLQALNALHLYQRDIHYILAGAKVQIVDENTGRVMAGRSWERGLHQMIEVKEGLPQSPARETLAKISYQLFFRRYVRLAGMTGTCREVRHEVAKVYGPGVTRVEPLRGSRRTCAGRLILADQDQKWRAVVAAVRRRAATGQPVLIGTRTIAASEELSGHLREAGLDHVVLNAKQDGDEAQVVAQAGEPGRITIATNMAGRGTDIMLTDASRAAGGLHVILTEHHENARVDRQLIGRSARQGDPGSWEAIVALDDEMMRALGWQRRLAGRALAVGGTSAWSQGLARLMMRWAQWRMEREHAKARQSLLASDLQTRKTLAYSGQME